MDFRMSSFDRQKQNKFKFDVLSLSKIKQKVNLIKLNTLPYQTVHAHILYGSKHRKSCLKITQ